MYNSILGNDVALGDMGVAVNLQPGWRCTQADALGTVQSDWGEKHWDIGHIDDMLYRHVIRCNEITEHLFKLDIGNAVKAEG